jgi:hypothetical protein
MQQDLDIATGFSHQPVAPIQALAISLPNARVETADFS